MTNIVSKFNSRLNSDRGDSNTVSQMLWISMAVVLVIFVGGLIFQAVSSKGQQVADCIKDSNVIFKSSGGNGTAQACS